ncbi:hypothetical protein PUNSTDRAFT_129444 [Punctularia strigosozonata HHB-11173 SS5]|uniref:uncharacterized protein n=1 Tax=Punctularia strigosozonata (strain HHB-11173) TaxID=741275 RepID=UPI0004417C1F|nr:uncharacterized protein PUNSTDRAFT_129444 [Punctularia strigosozonata HHB-11173 SS5]EIN13776.1 hypothetical protein PUNSTDRAFT_129444 [Punctularia strigosozonata HHB-11173 SS5]
MPASLGPFDAPKARSSPPPGPPRDYDSASRSDSSATAARPSSSFIAKRQSPPHSDSSGSPRSSGSHTHAPPSRSDSPFPQAYPSAVNLSAPPPPWSSDSEPGEPLLGWAQRSLRHRGDRPRWWATDDASRRRRRRDGWYLQIRRLYRNVRRTLRHPCLPSQPLTIFLTALLFIAFVVSVTLLLMHILNPDKEPLPWRAYCSVPSPYSSPHYPHIPSAPSALPHTASLYAVPFPPPNLETFAPVGLFVGIFSMDSYFERRMLIRTTWANHPRSREGAGEGDGGRGTSRTIVRFILGQPRKGDWERRIKLEMEKYNDIIILPIQENMNSGKTHSYFSWAAENAWVPPVSPGNDLTTPPPFSYSDFRGPAPPRAEHDPSPTSNGSWVRPDFVVKCDDDSFVMLAELEARLRIELHTTGSNLTNKPTLLMPYGDIGSSLQSPLATPTHVPADDSSATSPPYPIDAERAVIPPTALTSYVRAPPPDTPPPPAHPPSSLDDPLIYWGYLVKNRFMGGELYALSWALVDWVATDPGVKGHLRGAEDKQTAKWMNAHPRAHEIRWKSERCWMYDHPRSGTVYSHGFLFPSEVTRVRHSIMSYLGKSAQDILGSPWVPAIAVNAPTPPQWAHSSVSTFGVRYNEPVWNLTTAQSVEAMVEGSSMSMLQNGSPMTPEYAFARREGRRKRYEGARVGGTVVVHFIKKHMWFLETALALLEGDEVTELEHTEDLIGLGRTRPNNMASAASDEATPTSISTTTSQSEGDATLTDSENESTSTDMIDQNQGENVARHTSPWANRRKYKQS